MVDPPAVDDGCRSHHHRDLSKVTCTVGGSIPLAIVLLGLILARRTMVEDHENHLIKRPLQLTAPFPVDAPGTPIRPVHNQG